MKKLLLLLLCVPLIGLGQDDCISGDCENGYGTELNKRIGSKYVGEFKDSYQHGFGTLIFDSGNKYKGEFKNGSPNGQGTYTWPSGDKYVGEFKDTDFHG